MNASSSDEMITMTAMPLLPGLDTNSNSNATTTAASRQALVAYFTHKIYVLQLFLLCGYGIMFLLCVAFIWYLRHNRNVALRGDATAARKVILPAFEPLLWILGAATGTYTTFFATALGTRLFTSEISKVSSEFFYSGRQFVFVCVLVFLYQKSVSIPALRRALFISFLLSTYTIPIVWYLAHYAPSVDFYFALMGVRALLLVLYVYVFLRPPGRASKRTLREYCAYTFVYYALLFTYIELMRRRDFDTGFAFAYANLGWGSLCPLVIWRVLKADTEFWRGLGQRAVALQSLFRQRRSALDERVSSQGFHLLIELHRKYIIDFAYLEIQEQIGTGASSTVFHGVLHSHTHVAVKVYAPLEFSENTVAAFSHEAALCGALHHPNIVKFYGMCVCPPNICLVTELCVGSLDDVMKAVHARRHSNPDRQQFLLNLCYLLDAARAVAYLHSFSPPFVHRDIKPSNFLVDYKSSVKLTDFGESRSLPRPHSQAPHQHLHPYMLLASGAHVNSSGRYSSNLASSSGGGGPGLSGGGGSSSALAGQASSMTVRGTVDYMAPEVIQGRAGHASYGEAADVYSLAITMWDVLHPGKEKFPTLRNNHLRIFESVIEGNRPVLEDHLHPSLREIIENAWHSDVRLRPSAQTVVQILESIQEEIQAVFAAQLLSEIDSESITRARQHGSRANTSGDSNRGSSGFSPADYSFTGAEAVSHMVDSGYALGEGEAVRLGHALMDAGHLHHLRHAKGFEDSPRELYYLDEDNISLCRPIHPFVPTSRRTAASPIEEDEGSGEADDSGDGDDGEEEEKVDTSGSRPSPLYTSDSTSGRGGAAERPRRRPRPLVEQHGLCACRKLGQRLHVGRSHSDKRSGRSAKTKRRTKPKAFTARVGTIMEEMSSTALTRSLLVEEDRASDTLEATHSYSDDHVVININGPAGA